MSQASQLLYSIATSRQNIPPGGTLAVFVDVQQGQLWTQIKNIGNTGGLELLQCSNGSSLVSGGSQLYTTPNFISGSTLSAAMLAAVSGTGYLMSPNEIVPLQGPCRFYISAPSATCTVAILKGLGSGV